MYIFTKHSNATIHGSIFDFYPIERQIRNRNNQKNPPCSFFIFLPMIILGDLKSPQQDIYELAITSTE
jgi:hypothetical protein